MSPHCYPQTAPTHILRALSLSLCGLTFVWLHSRYTRDTTQPSGVPHVSLASANMALDFQNSNLELQLEASLAQQEAQANETRALLAQLKQSSAQQLQQQQQHQQPAPGYSPSDVTFQYTPGATTTTTSSSSSPTSSSAPTRHGGGGHPVPSHGASRPQNGQPALVRTSRSVFRAPSSCYCYRR